MGLPEPHTNANTPTDCNAEIAKQALEHYGLDPLSWYRIEVSPDDGAADWRVVFDGSSHASQPGSSMKVVLVNKQTGRAAYMPGYWVLMLFQSR